MLVDQVLVQRSLEALPPTNYVMNRVLQIGKFLAIQKSALFF